MLFSCFAGSNATKDDNKDIKKILKDGSFLFFNYFSDSEFDTNETADTLEHTIKFRADEDYAYNIVKVTEGKEDVAGFRNIEYSIMLDQSKGRLVVEGKYKTEEDIEGFISKDIVEKLVTNTEKFDKVVLNKHRINPGSVSMDIF